MFKRLLFKYYVKKNWARLSALKERGYIAFISIYDFHCIMVVSNENYSHYTSIILKREPKTKFYTYLDYPVIFIK